MTIEGEVLSIPEWTHRWLTQNERYLCQGVSERIIEKALELLGEKKTYQISDGENIIGLNKPHGSMGYEKTKVIIDITRDNKKLAAYLFLNDETGQIMVINRPNNWIAVKNNGHISVLNPKPGRRVTEMENYEVGEAELQQLLAKIS